MVEGEGRSVGHEAEIVEIRLRVAAAVKAIHEQLERIQQAFAAGVQEEGGGDGTERQHES